MPDPVSEQIAALKDDDWAVREDAAKALGLLIVEPWSRSSRCCGMGIVRCGSPLSMR